MSRVGPGTGGNAEFSRVDASLKRPVTDEIVIAWERRHGTRTRYTGASLGYQLAAPLAGGLAPLIASGLLGWSGGATWPVAVYLALLAVIMRIDYRVYREPAFIWSCLALVGLGLVAVLATPALLLLMRFMISDRRRSSPVVATARCIWHFRP